MATNNLVRLWIKYLKDNKIVKAASDPKTGKLDYIRNPTAADLYDFLEELGIYDDHTISSAIRSVIRNKSHTNTNTSGTVNPQNLSRSQSAKNAPPQQQNSTNNVVGNVGTQQNSQAPLDHATIRANKQAAAAKSAQNQMTPKPQSTTQPTQAPLDPATIRANKQAAAAKSAQNQMTPKPLPRAQLLPQSPTVAGLAQGQATPKQQKNQPTKRPIARLLAKPINGRTNLTLKESLVDKLRVDVSEDDVEEIFRLLGSNMDDTTVQTPDDDTESLGKIKGLIQNSMPPEHRKMLWALLKGTKSMAEAYIKDRYMTDVFAGLIKANSRVKMTPDDLKAYWEKVGSPNDSEEIERFLLKLGYSEQDIQDTFENILGYDVDDSEDSAQDTNPVRGIADYIIKADLVDEVLSFIENSFPKDLQDNSGFFKKMATSAKNLFKEGLNHEHIVEIFNNMSDKPRVLPYSGILR